MNIINAEGQGAPRGLAHYACAGPKVFAGVTLSLAVSVFLLWQDLWLFRGWSELFYGLGGYFGFGAVEVVLSRDPALLANVVTTQSVPGMPWSTALAGGLGVVLWLISSVLRKMSLPAVYLIRALSLIIGLPAMGALALGYEPKLDLSAHLAGLFKLGYWFVVCTPAVMALTAFTLPGNLVKKWAILLLAVSYFYVFIPILALFHLMVLHLLGAAFLPALNVLFSVIVLSAQLVAFYGWMASVEESV